MNALKIILAALAVWRLTHLFHVEDGPFRVFGRIRDGVRRLALGELVDCFYCLSLWMATPFAVWLGSDWLERAVLWMALSATAILINRFVEAAEAAENARQAALYYEEPYKEEPECLAVEAHDEKELRTLKRPPVRSA
jgi:Protein of unknown function (DUF1360)